MRTPLAERTSALALMAAIALAPATSPGGESPWPSDVAGFTWAQPGEHPRLLFHKGDLPELRKRAETPEGKAILQRLRFLLDGANGELRSGSSWAIAALGYDLCYDGFTPADRVRIAKAFLTAKGQQGHNLEKVVRKPKYRPSKNHMGGILCGAVAAAALYDDPGTEGAKIREEWLPDAYRNTLAMLTQGFGDHGWYAESQGPSHVSSDTGLLVWLKAARVACGKDFVSARPNAQYLTLRWAMEIIPQEGRPQYPLRMAAGPSYGTHEFTRWGDWSHGGQFAQGFGAILDEQRPALLWVYKNFVEPYESQPAPTEKWAIEKGWLRPGEKTFDGTTSPWRAVLAFVNWPIGVEPRNPEGILPKAIEDRVHGYYCFRNRWQDGDDIVVTALLGYGPKDAYKPKFGPIVVWGLRKRYEFGVFTAPGPGEFEAKPNGSGTVSAGGKHLGVDFSGASGAPLLMAMVGIQASGLAAPAAIKTVASDGQQVTVFTLQAGEPPQVSVEGEAVRVGGQTIRFDGKRIAFAR